VVCRIPRRRATAHTRRSGAVPLVATRRMRSDTSGEGGLGLVIAGMSPTVSERNSKIRPYAGIDELRQKVLFMGWLVGH
jgi:hypothetical protein